MILIKEKRSRPSRRTAALTLLVAMLAGLLGLAASAVPASAHSGGRAVVLVRSLSVEPAGNAWQAKAVLTDSDSGSPIRGSKVTVSAAGTAAAKEVTMSQGTVPGFYEGTLSNAKPGSPLTITLKVRAVPGSEPVLPYDRKFEGVQLVAGEPLVLVSGGGGGGSNLPLIMGVAGAVLAVAMLYGLYSVRRRTAVPVKK